jgi:MerR family transcriptional regulator, light-induced transcriptional regulator
VPSEAARLFAEQAHRLAGEVSRLIAGHPRLAELLGGNPFRLLEAKHRHDAALMAEVLRIGDLDLLTRSLPWTYHAYHAQGIPFEYFPIDAETWQTVIRACLPEGAARALTPIYAWIGETHWKIVHAAAQHGAQHVGVPEELSAAYPRLVDCLIGADHGGALDLCHDLLRQGLSFVGLMQRLFYPAMVEVGVGWENGRLTVDMEHQATATAYVVLSTLYYEQPFPTVQRGRALVAAVTNELHEMGAWMLTTCLELDGWEVDLLSSDCALEELLQAVRRAAPHFVALSITLVSNAEIARKTVAAIRATLPKATGAKILVGGRALLIAPSLAESIGADLTLTDCESAVSWARGLGVRR